MDQMQSFAADCAELLTEECAAGRIPRREALKLAGALGLAAFSIPGGPAAAQQRPRVVLVNFGGDAMAAFRDAFVIPFERSGGRMVLDGSGPSNGRIRTMVQARNVTWDICDSGVAGIGELGPLNMLEPIDYDIVDRAKVPQEFAYRYGVVNYMFSTVMAWDTRKVSQPPTLQDFFDVRKYPGKRMLRRAAQAMMELALMADGVPMDKLYPLDEERAFRKLATIKDHALFWNSGAESQSLMRDGECVMGWLWHTRANLLKRDTDSRIDYSFRDGLLQPGLWVVPRGNPAGKEAMVAIASMQQPEGQISLLRAMGNGPANPAAHALVPAELKPTNPADPANAALQARISAEWYERRGAATHQRFLDMISS